MLPLAGRYPVAFWDCGRDASDDYLFAQPDYLGTGYPTLYCEMGGEQSRRGHGADRRGWPAHAPPPSRRVRVVQAAWLRSTRAATTSHLPILPPTPL